MSQRPIVECLPNFFEGRNPAPEAPVQEEVDQLRPLLAER